MSHSFELMFQRAAQTSGGIDEFNRFLKVQLLAYDDDDAPEYSWQDPNSTVLFPPEE